MHTHIHLTCSAAGTQLGGAAPVGRAWRIGRGIAEEGRQHVPRLKDAADAPSRPHSRPHALCQAYMLGS